MLPAPLMQQMDSYFLRIESLPLAEYGTERYTGYHNKELDAISL